MNFNTKIDQNQVTPFEQDEIIYFAVGNSEFDKVGRFEPNAEGIVDSKMKWKPACAPVSLP